MAPSSLDVPGRWTVVAVDLQVSELHVSQCSHRDSWEETHQDQSCNVPAVNILGTDVDVVESYKYLGVHLNNNLDWTHNTDALVKKGNSRLFLLRRLGSFGVQGPLLRTFYDSVVGSAIFYGIVCWSSSITDRYRKRMDRLVRRASSVLECPLDLVEVVGNGRMMAKLSSMLNNTSHPLQDTLTALGSSFSKRLLHPCCAKERYRRSFLPAAVRLHNKNNAR
ncbi:hypothetical protein D4764_04G0012790 [Takifugu flavidus]|uniref:Alkylated DNA repair protein AlkB homologue 8 N-terminal domain-containing protein n=1 Tax=Takifugu flavidus TaxID=433684 RepID=A0A5C6N580_9TELE|nr:hypothetical protein D4764_04G0012790 [Takifugu flavidus]